MSKPIEDYALLSSLHCAALVARDGSIDWFCPGRFDAPACFSALLGDERHGYWSIAPRDVLVDSHRHYQVDTLVLETHFETAGGSARILDAMPMGPACHIIRLVEGISGTVTMQMACHPRFHFGKHAPRLHRESGQQIIFQCQEQRLLLNSDLELTPGDAGAETDFVLHAGEQHWFVLSYSDADQRAPDLPDPRQALVDCANHWRDWISRCDYRGRWESEVRRSLITLKAMIYMPTGGMVAAPTTSLPEVPGGSANYDYRFCWLRDTAFALAVLLNEGFRKEACHWRDWLLKIMDLHDEPLHALYTLEATVAPPEELLDWLPGYANSRPVRAGNAASRQYQLDVRGELMEILHLARKHGLDLRDEIWALQCDIMSHLETRWREPDTGIWEFRTLCDHLTHSKVLSWVAFDRCIKDAETFGFDAPLDKWRRLRDDIRTDILEHGIDPEGGHFTQRYGNPEVDASLLMIPLMGFLPADDPRMLATVKVIERDLCEDGLVRRYRSGDQANEEGLFLACCFWLADNYCLSGRQADAERLFERLLSLANDVGLLAEEYDPRRQVQLGNFPQGLSHLGLISTAKLIAKASEADVDLT
ncbi:glycoside hydrolase family 15 protein [Cellvibrio sp. ARAG 10.3]|uniref:glycoside hydrolase family 15 protein n=1 Tax=Cellvibrio sp. ARAG 10.3 TaxID=3451358 RepID=UPI003F46AC94